MGAFAEDTVVHGAGGGAWTGELSDRWQTPGGTPNGGYVLAVAARAMAAALPGHPHPATVTAHYLDRAAPGAVTIHVDIIRVGGRHATATSRVVQGDREVVRVLGTFTDLGRAEGPTVIGAAPPPLPPREQCKTKRGPDLAGAPGLLQRFDWATPPEHLEWASGRGTGVATIGGWARFTDGDTEDPFSLLVLADAFAPPIFNLHEIDFGWVPTLELTVQVRGLPAPGWMRGWFETPFLRDGYLTEDGQIWDSRDDIVAVSRQLALAPRRR